MRYQLSDSFLLDVESGRVWRYDQNSNRFENVERATTAIEKSWENVLTAKLAADLVTGFAEATKTSSMAEYKRVGGFLDAHLKLVDDHLVRLAKK